MKVKTLKYTLRPPFSFESTNFSLLIKKFPRPHVSVLNSNLPFHAYPTRIRIQSQFVS